MLEPDKLMHADRRRREGEREGTIDMRGRDQLHPLDCLDATLHLLRLCRLGAEAINECMQMGDLPLLPGMGGLLLGERLRPLALEVRVVAAVEAKLARVEMDDRTHDRVQKIAIVRDEEQ